MRFRSERLQATFSPLALLAAGLLAATTAGSAQADLVFAESKLTAKASPLDREVFARFPFKNAGTRAVHITKLESDCSCTTPTIAQPVVAPGETGEVAVRFETGPRHGLQRRVIIASTDDPAQPVCVLNFNIEMAQVVALEPQSMLWTVEERGQTKTMLIKTSAEPPVREVRAVADSPQVRVELERRSATEYVAKLIPTPGATDVTTALRVEAVLANGQGKQANAFLRLR